MKVVKDFKEYQQAAGDALDIKSGMVANAVPFMTSIESIQQRMEASFSQLRDLQQQRTGAMAQSSVHLRDRNTYLILGGHPVGGGALAVAHVVELKADRASFARSPGIGQAHG